MFFFWMKRCCFFEIGFASHFLESVAVGNVLVFQQPEVHFLEIFCFNKSFFLQQTNMMD